MTPLDVVLFSCIPLACLCTEGSGALAEAVNQGQLLRGGDTQDDDGGGGGSQRGGEEFSSPRELYL